MPAHSSIGSRLPALATAVACVFALAMVVGARPVHAATITVANCNDSGLGSLRQALAFAVDGDVIDLSGLGCPTIALTGGELAVNESVTIDGPGSGLLTLNAGGADRVLSTSAGKSVEIAA